MLCDEGSHVGRPSTREKSTLIWVYEADDRSAGVNRPCVAAIVYFVGTYPSGRSSTATADPWEVPAGTEASPRRHVT
jgi:hypothetical protein